MRPGYITLLLPRERCARPFYIVRTNIYVFHLPVSGFNNSAFAFSRFMKPTCFLCGAVHQSL